MQLSSPFISGRPISPTLASVVAYARTNRWVPAGKSTRAAPEGAGTKRSVPSSVSQCCGGAEEEEDEASCSQRKPACRVLTRHDLEVSRKCLRRRLG